MKLPRGLYFLTCIYLFYALSFTKMNSCFVLSGIEGEEIIFDNRLSLRRTS